MSTRDLRHIVVAVLLLASGTASANMLDTEPQTRNSPVITTPEAVKLEPFSGSAVYSYRFELPPGTGGLTPDLVLSYSTLTRGTEYGWGWSLNLSRIERSTRFGPPAYDDAGDDFELDGELLVRDPTIAGRFHRTRTDFSRIQYFASGGPSTSYWEVTRPDGLSMRYGAISGAKSRLTTGSGLTGSTFRWMLDEVVDARGNSYRIEYRCDPEPGGACTGAAINVYPARIRYSFRSSAEAPSSQNKRTLRLVTFDWEERGYGTGFSGEDRDRPTSFRSGFKTQIGLRLAGVRIGIDADGDGILEGADQVRRYKLDYTPKFSNSNSTTRTNPPFSQLASIQRYGAASGNGSDTEFPSSAHPAKTTFAYNRPSRGFAAANDEREVWTPPSNGPEGGAIRFAFNSIDTTAGLWDMNGDGVLDRVKTRPNLSPKEWKVNFGIVRTDGGLGYGEAVKWGWCSSAGQTDCPTTIPPGDDTKDRLVNVDAGAEWKLVRDDLVDMDGDALPDRISANEDGNWTFRKNLGMRFGEERVWAGPNLAGTEVGSGEILKVRVLNATKETTGGSGSWETRARLIDINGDGRPDHVASTPNETSYFYVSFNLGCQPGVCGFDNPIAIPGRLPEPGALSKRNKGDFQSDSENILDMNGDGLPDLAFRRHASGSTDCIEVGFGDGNGFQTYSSTGYIGGSEDCESGSTLWVTSDLAYGDHQSASPVTYRATIDVNGDGIVDRLGCVYTAQSIPLCEPVAAFGLGDGTFTDDAVEWQMPTYALREGDEVKIDTIDLDGDGLVESVETTSTCDNCTSYVWKVWDNMAAGNGPEWLLASVRNEIGGQTLTTYESSAKSRAAATSLSRNYLPEVLSASTVAAPQHGWVVKSITLDDGRAGSPVQQQLISYAEPRYDYFLRENRGFRMSESTDAADTTTRSLFHQSLERRGLMEYQEVVADGQALRSHETFYSTEAPKNETGAAIIGASFASPVFERVSLFSAGSRQDHTFLRVFEPMFGNMLREYDLGADAVAFTDDDLVTFSEFSSVDIDKWLIKIPSARYQKFGTGILRFNDQSFEYASGLVSRRTVSRYDPVAGTSDLLVENWDHDEFGNTTSYRPPSRGLSSPPQIETSWDSSFGTFPVVITRNDGAGVTLQTRYAFNPALGEAEKKLDPLGHLECWIFDQFGRLAERSDLGTPATDLSVCDTPRATFAFSAESDNYLGLPDEQYLSTRQYSWPATSAGPARSIESRQHFDGLGRVYREANQAKSADYFVTARAFGPRGELSCESQPARTDAPGIANVSCGSSAAPSEINTFDALLRPTQHLTRLAAAGGDRLQETISYSLANQDGLAGDELVERHTVFASPSPNLIREVGKDRRGDTVSVFEVGGGTTYLRRDPAGRITLVDGPDVAIAGGGTDANLLALTYNSEGQRVAFARPDAISSIGSAPKTIYGYDVDGNLAQTLPARGANYAITYSYDGLSRLRFKDVAPSNSIASPGPTDTTYEYDQSSYFGSVPGKLSRISTGEVTTEFGYDFRGRATAKRRIVGSTIYRTSFAFDLLDRNIATYYPDRSFIARMFDGALLASLHDPTLSQYLSYQGTNDLPAAAPVLVDTIEFHPSGALQGARFVRGNVNVANSFSTADYRLAQSLTAIPALPTEHLIFGYDTAGNVTSIDDSTNLLDEAFTYDDLHRLANVIATGTHGYAPSGMIHEYDPSGSGNLTRKGDLLLAYGGMGAGPHAVTAATTSAGFVAAYTYDLDGNVSGKALDATDESEVFGHDAENRLVSYSYLRPGGTGQGTYQYDDTGARVSRSAFKVDAGLFNVITIDPEYEVDHQRVRTLVHVFIGGTRVATIERALTSATTGPPSPIARELHLHPNHLGTPRLITDQNGAIVQRTLLKPFGEVWKVLDGAGNQLHPLLRPSDYMFTGQHADAESSLHYFGARYYDPLIGRFMEVDPELVGPTAGVTFERMSAAPQSLDGHAYAENRPSRFVDADGRQSIDPTMGVARAYAGGISFLEPQLYVDPVDSMRFNAALGLGLLGGGLGPVTYGWAMSNPTLAYALGYETLEMLNPGPPLSPAGVAGNALGDAIGGAARGASLYGREIKLLDGFYQAEGSAFTFSKFYYEKLWTTGRPAPFLQAEEALATARTVTPDAIRPGFYRYVNDVVEMVYNPTTKEVWHLAPLPGK